MQTISIEEKAIKTYHKNMIYLQEKQRGLYKKIVDFETALERGYYSSRYELEYKEEGYFDVLEKETEKYLYGKDSNRYAEIAAESIDYEKRENLFETFHLYRFSEEGVRDLNEQHISENGFSAIAPIMHFTTKVATKETTMRAIKKFLFFGTGLGTHLETIHNKIRSEVYLIIEEDLELFRLSLFVTDYAHLGEESTLYFSVFDEEDVFREQLNTFLEDRFIYNHYLKYFFMLSAHEEMLKKTQSHFASQSQLLFTYNALLANYIKPLQHLKNGYRILNIHALSKMDPFKKKPILVLAAGPSLARNIGWVKENANKFVIIAVTAVLKQLEKAGIKPDIITHVHSFEDSNAHLNNLESIDFIKDAVAIFSASAPVSFVKRFDSSKVYLIEGVTAYKKEFGIFSASNVGNFSAGIAFLLGSEKIYLLGLDLAMDQKTGKTHIDTHSFVDQVDLQREEALEDAVDLKKSLLEIRGNFTDKITTSVLFDTYIYEFSILVDHYKKPYQQVYNLSEGAYLKDTIPLHPEDFDIMKSEKIDKVDLYNKVFKVFENFSAKELTSEEKKHLDSRLEYAEKVRSTLARYQNRKYANIDEYQYHLIGLIIELLGSEEEQTLDLSMIYQNYFQYIMSFIFDMLNTRELENPKHKIKKIHKILIEQLSKIEKVYEEGVQEYLGS